MEPGLGLRTLWLCLLLFSTGSCFPVKGDYGFPYGLSSNSVGGGSGSGSASNPQSAKGSGFVSLLHEPAGETSGQTQSASGVDYVTPSSNSGVGLGSESRSVKGSGFVSLNGPAAKPPKQTQSNVGAQPVATGYDWVLRPNRASGSPLTYSASSLGAKGAVPQNYKLDSRPDRGSSSVYVLPDTGKKLVSSGNSNLDLLSAQDPRMNPVGSTGTMLFNPQAFPFPLVHHPDFAAAPVAYAGFPVNPEVYKPTAWNYGSALPASLVFRAAPQRVVPPPPPTYIIQSRNGYDHFRDLFSYMSYDPDYPEYFAPAVVYSKADKTDWSPPASVHHGVKGQ